MLAAHVSAGNSLNLTCVESASCSARVFSLFEIRMKKGTYAVQARFTVLVLRPSHMVAASRNMRWSETSRAS